MPCPSSSPLDTFVIVDNHVDEILRLTDLLKSGYPGVPVLPNEESHPGLRFTSWDGALQYVVRVKGKSVVACLDLALTSGPNEESIDAVGGLEKARAVRAAKPEWILIAYTRYSIRVQPEPAFNETFDGVIEKGELDSYDRRDDRVEFVKRQVNAAIRKRRGSKGVGTLNLHVEDSLGLRTFLAAFGDATLDEILDNEASSWGEVNVTALTTGHSGAFMLSIKGKSEGGVQSLIIKVAHDVKIIQDEIQATKRYLAQLGVLNGHFSQLDPFSKALSSKRGVYYRQAQVIGSGLLELIRGKPWEENVWPMEKITNFCLAVCGRTPPKDCATQDATSVFTITPLDISRLETSARFLGELGRTLQKQAWLPLDLDPEKVASDVVQMAKEWSGFIKVKVKTILQHGDLNPGNVFLQTDGFPVLIDLSRLGPWPVGYDLSRLALSLRLRLTDADGRRDWLPQNLKTWLLEPAAEIDKIRDPVGSVCSEAVYCEQQFRLFLEGLPGEFRETLARGFHLGSLWDLIKFVSYQDISPFKKMWALLECWRLKSLFS
jgi:hypothetical protein